MFEVEVVRVAARTGWCHSCFLSVIRWCSYVTNVHLQLLEKSGQATFQESNWFKAGAQIFNADGLNYLGKPSLVHAQSIIATLGVQVRLNSCLFHPTNSCLPWGGVHTLLFAREACGRREQTKPLGTLCTCC